MTLPVPAHTNNHDYAVGFTALVEVELKPYNHTPSLHVANFWNLVLDVGSGIEEHSPEADSTLQDLYATHDIVPLREGYLEKWWTLYLKSSLLRAQNRWWLSLNPKNVTLTAEATDLLQGRYRAAWRLYTAERLHQKGDRFNLDPWQKALGRLQDETTQEELNALQVELF